MEYPRKIKAVFIGTIKLDGDKRGAGLRELQDGKPFGENLAFDAKALVGSVIGGIYEIDQTEENKFALSQRKYVGMYGDSALVAEWQLRSQTDRILEDAARMEKKDKDLPAALEMLEPLRVIYRRAMPDRKRAIEVVLINYLRKL